MTPVTLYLPIVIETERPIDASLVAPGDLEESVRGQRDLNQPCIVAPVTNDVLNHLARNWSHAALTGRRIERTCASASRREIHVAADRFLAHRGRSVVDGRDVLRQLESRPRCTRARRLPNSEARAGARILDGLADSTRPWRASTWQGCQEPERWRAWRCPPAPQSQRCRTRDRGLRTVDRASTATSRPRSPCPCAEPGPNWKISILTPAGSVAFGNHRIVRPFANLFDHHAALLQRGDICLQIGHMQPIVIEARTCDSHWRAAISMNVSRLA